MAFQALQKLGPEKVTKLTNELMRGTPAMALARTVQGEWGDLQGVAEKTLTQMLNRFKMQLIADGALGKEQQVALAEKGKLDIKFLRGSRLEVLERLVSIANLQENRIDKLLAIEAKSGGMVMSALTGLLESYAELLLKIQKIQFDLGLDEYKGILQNNRYMSQTIQNADGSIEQKVMIEATEVLQKVFKMRGIGFPPVVEGR